MRDHQHFAALHNGVTVVGVDSEKWGEPPIDQSVFYLALISHEMHAIETRAGGNFRLTHETDTITFVRPGEVQAVTAAYPDRINRVAMSSFIFTEKLAQDAIGEVNLDGLREIKDPTMANLLKASATLNDKSDPLLVDHLTLAILHRVRGLRQHPDVKNQGRIERSINYIKERLEHKITLTELANAASMSNFHYLRTFRSVTGMTPLSYITQKRIERAKSLMVKTNHPLAVVALMCGFSSQSHFSTAFKDATGSTPMEFLRSVKGKVVSTALALLLCVSNLLQVAQPVIVEI